MCAAERATRGATEHRGEDKVALELLHLLHAVDEGAIRPHHARGQLRVDALEQHTRLHHLHGAVHTP